MNAAHISDAIAAMEDAIRFIKQLPYSGSKQFSDSVDVTGKLAGESHRLKTELSKLKMEVEA